VDVGTGWNSRSANPDPKTLIGAGLGLVWQMGDKLTARFDWGIPLVNANRGDRSLQEKGLYFQLEYKGF
jgi:hemolysin activation/secretion protein